MRTYSTVRRLVVHVAGLPEAQPDREEEVTGPSVKAAFASDGSPTPAAVGFAKGQGVGVDALRVVKGAKGEVIAATKLLPGRPVPEVLAEITVRVVRGLHFPKTMRWGKGEHVFVRPLHNLLAVFGKRTFTTQVPVELFGVAASTGTYGHRTMAPARIELSGGTGFAAYLKRLGAAGVNVDPEARRAVLEEEARRLAAEVGCEIRPDPELLAELVELVEHPGVLRGEIAEHFLQLPEEVLVTTLRHHQKCLVLTREGRVAPYFLAVCDRSGDPQGLIQRGNEWVAGARLTDAAFFFAQDRKAPLASRRPALEKVLVHQKLGTFARKTEIVAKLAAALAESAGAAVDAAALARACELLKADLVTAMVGEFAELQGVIGGIYARLDGEPEAVWQAVYDQYTPAGLEGALPRGPVAAAVGVADRLDSLAGLFAAGEVPSGSKDPFALRRAALAVGEDLRRGAARVRPAGGGDRGGALRGGGDEAAAALREFVPGARAPLPDGGGRREAGGRRRGARRPLGRRSRTTSRAPGRSRRCAARRCSPRSRWRSSASATWWARAAREASPPSSCRRRPSASCWPRSKGPRARWSAPSSAATSPRACVPWRSSPAPLDAFFTDVLVICDDEALRAARLALLARVEKLFLRLADVSRLSAQ